MQIITQVDLIVFYLTKYKSLSPLVRHKQNLNKFQITQSKPRQKYGDLTCFLNIPRHKSQIFSLQTEIIINHLMKFIFKLNFEKTHLWIRFLQKISQVILEKRPDLNQSNLEVAK